MSRYKKTTTGVIYFLIIFCLLANVMREHQFLINDKFKNSSEFACESIPLLEGPGFEPHSS